MLEQGTELEVAIEVLDTNWLELEVEIGTVLDEVATGDETPG